MARVRVDPSYHAALKNLSSDLRKRADRALEKFLENPQRKGLRFERLVGWPDYFSIRVSRSYRILLRREHDDDGELFAAVDVGSHDDVYRRRR
jgi:mRNA-degrading endonuclease RelE of RelBE toxin-antitoxin system